LRCLACPRLARERVARFLFYDRRVKLKRGESRSSEGGGETRGESTGKLRFLSYTKDDYERTIVDVLSVTITFRQIIPC